MTFEAEGIRKLFQVLDPEKRKRPDNILTQILRETASEIKEDVCFLFWSILQVKWSAFWLA